MKHVTIRPAEPRDSQNYFDWLRASSHINLVDYGVYNYPTCYTVVVEKHGAPILMTSFHVVMLEALAPKPGLSAMDEARALKVLFDSVEETAKEIGAKEIWFGCSDPRVQTFAERHGIERVTYPVFRKKLCP